jgi:hypothetical protein
MQLQELTKTELVAYLNSLSPQQLSELDKELYDDGEASDGPALAALGWRAGYEALFGKVFTDGLASHHAEGVEWHWDARLAFLRGEEPQYDAYFPIWSRGHNKSGVARRIAVADGILSFQSKTPAYILYLSRNKDMALKHAKSIETLLQSKRVKAVCPEIAEVQRNDQKKSKGWTASFIYTKANVIYHFAGLDEGLAGGNIETNVEEAVDDDSFRPDVRVTMFVPDDIDGREDSPVIAESRFKTLTNEVLPMGQENSLVFFAQNLISRYSCMYRIWKQQARVLTGRKPTQPVKAVLNLKTEVKTVGGIVQDVFVSGTPTWPVWDAKRIQREINRFGLPAFLRECQHEVEQDSEGLVVKSYDDSVHVISRSMFAATYGTRDIPFKWSKRVFNDWARTNTKYHCNVAGILTTSAQNSALPGCIFLFHPMSFPANSSPEDVAVRLLTAISPRVRAADGELFTWRQLLDSTLKGFRLESLIRNETDLIKARRDVLATVIPKYVQPILKAQHYNDFRGSHEQSKTGALAVYQKVFGLPFNPVNPGGDGGIDLLNLIMRVDYEEDHPFIPGKKGFSNYYVVAEDDRSRSPLYVTAEGVEVYPPTPYNDALTPDELTDADRLRYQFSNCRYRDPVLTAAGEKEGEILKLDDDFINGHQFCFHDGVLPAAPLTHRELVHEHIAPHLRPENMPKVEGGVGLKPEDELAALLARRDAEKRVKPTRQRFDEYGRRIG